MYKHTNDVNWAWVVSEHVIILQVWWWMIMESFYYHGYMANRCCWSYSGHQKFVTLLWHHSLQIDGHWSIRNPFLFYSMSPCSFYQWSSNFWFSGYQFVVVLSASHSVHEEHFHMLLHGFLYQAQQPLATCVSRQLSSW